MKTISIFNNKGGVAKTISTINIGAVLQELGKKVLIVDIDPQGNSSRLLNNKEVRNGRSIDNEDCYRIDSDTVTELLLDSNVKASDIIKHTAYEGLDIITSNNELEFAETDLLSYDEIERVNKLYEKLKEVDELYDYCIIDCSPNFNCITINGLMASDEVIVPLKIDQMSIDGIGTLLSRIDEIKEHYNSKVDFGGCFVTMDKATSVNKLMKGVLSNFLNEKLLRTSIKEDNKVTESTFRQKPVVFYKKNCNATQGYKKLVDELFFK
jgi:chromosome partitioning protein